MAIKSAFTLAKIIRNGTTDKRSLLIYKNITQSVFVKGAGILLGFLTVPLTLEYITVDDFGIWMTLTFLTSWFSLVDVSFGNGLRNKLVFLFHSGNHTTARIYVSTVYALSVGLALLLAILFLTVGHFLNWSSLLNIQSNDPEEINTIIQYTLLSFCAQLILKPINSILYADQKAAWTGIILLLTNASIFIIIYYGVDIVDKSLFVIAHIYNLTPLGILGLLSFYLFRRYYSDITPRLRDIDFSLSQELLNLGGQFFILQLSSIVVFTSGGLFISHFSGSASVGPYSIANKYFSLITVLYGIVITPYWSAFTDAYAKQDKDWIQQTIRQLNRIGLGITLLAGFMLAVSGPVFKLWIGPKVYIPSALSVWLTAYVISFVFLSNYNSVLNGTGQIRLLVYASLVGLALYVGLVTVLFRWLAIGPSSVVIAGTIWNLSMLLVCLHGYKRIVRALTSNNQPTAMTNP